jgi:hypothetical protein
MITFTFSMDLTKPLYASSGGKHQLGDASIQLVQHEHWSDALTDSLAEHSLGLHANSFDAVNYDQVHHQSLASAAVTSELKSTCPGESIKLIKKDLSLILIPDSSATFAAS